MRVYEVAKPGAVAAISRDSGFMHMVTAKTPLHSCVCCGGNNAGNYGGSVVFGVGVNIIVND